MKHQFKPINRACLLVAMASAAVCAHADVTIGGVFDVGYVSDKTPGLTTKKVDGSLSDLTRIVINGDVALKNGVKAIFTVESDFFNPGSKSSNTGSFANGEVQAGLTGGFGTIQAGRVNTATFFNTLFYQPYGTAIGSAFGSYTNGVVRYDNSAKYTTPSLNGLKASLLFSAKNPNSTDNAKNTSGVTEFGLSYNNGPLSVGFANLKSEIVANASGNGNNDSFANLGATKEYVVNSLGASYNVGKGLKLMALMDSQKADSGAKERSHTALSAVYVTGQNQFSGTVGTFKDKTPDAAATGSSAMYTTLGYDYFLDDKATSAVYARYTSTDDKTLRYGGTATYAGTYSTVAVGYRFAF